MATVDDIDSPVSTGRGEVDATGMVHVGGPHEMNEGLADGAVTPGAILVRGTNEDDVAEAGADAPSVLGYALENNWREVDPENVSSGDTPFLDDYSDNDEVPYNEAVGARFRGLLASGENVNKDDPLKTAANGELQAFTSGTDAGDLQNFQALEDVDNSGGGSAVRILVKRVS